jgi:L-ascorbate metabolism protein UlaG (beta-lactamase superfamily)
VLGNVHKWRLGKWSPVHDEAPGPAPAARVDVGIRVTLVGHATVLVQMDGFNILTDPVWSARCGPGGVAGPRRVRPAAVRLEDLPPIDLVLLSHNHFDHLDVPTLVALRRRHAFQLYTGLGNATLLRKHGIDAVEMDWWGTAAHRGLGVTCVPAQHFSGRGLFDRDNTLWAGLVVEGPSGRVYFAGDTGWGDHFEAIRDRCGEPAVALLPIGAYRPREIMQPVHIDPAEAVRAHVVLGAARSVPIHYGTFPLGADGEVDAIEDLARALAAEGVDPAHFAPLEHGVAADFEGARKAG